MHLINNDKLLAACWDKKKHNAAKSTCVLALSLSWYLTEVSARKAEWAHPFEMQEQELCRGPLKVGLAL